MISFYEIYLYRDLKILNHFSNLRDNFLFDAIRHKRYAIIFGLTRFGIDEILPHFSCVGD